MEEVRKVVAIINYELAKSHVALDSLTSKRDMTINMLNTVNFMQGGTLGCVAKSIDFKYGYFMADKEISEVSFGTSAGLPAIGLFVPSMWSRRIDSPPNTLARIFDPNYKPPASEQSYLWKFMNSPIPASPIKLTRREILIKHWEELEGLNSKDQKRIKRLAATPEGEESLREGIRIISQRNDLLFDLKTHIEEFDGSLYELHKVISMNFLTNRAITW
jgi:hypothetical protein